MSLSDLLTNPATRCEARTVLDDLLPEYDRTVGGEPRVQLSCPHPQLVGIAFDYAARMEIEHLAEAAVAHGWMAEVAVHLLPQRSKAQRAARRVVEDARAAAARWPHERTARHAAIAAQAAKLCQLDAVCRAAGLAPTFGEADGIAENLIAAEVAELLAHAEPLWHAAVQKETQLNPRFGTASIAVGGADADLIAGTSLIEIKTTKAARIERDHMRQLVGYACLAHSSGLYQVKTVAVYFSRFGVLYEVPLRRGVPVSAYVRAATELAALWRRREAA